LVAGVLELVEVRSGLVVAGSERSSCWLTRLQRLEVVSVPMELARRNEALVHKLIVGRTWRRRKRVTVLSYVSEIVIIRCARWEKPAGVSRGVAALS
jgi:hypothetical protein